MSRTILPKIKDIWNRFKWYITVAIFIVALATAFIFLTGDRRVSKGIVKWMIEKKADSLNDRLKYFEESDMKNDEKIVKLEEQIKDVKETYKEIDRDVEGRDVSELSKAFKRLGY